MSIDTISRLRSLRPVNRRARHHLWQALMALLPESGCWTRAEREEFMALVRYLIDWIVVTEEEI